MNLGMKKSLILVAILLISISCFNQKKNVKPLIFQQKKAWPVDELIKLAESKGINALIGIVNPSQILYVDTMQSKKLIELEIKVNSDFNKSYEFEQFKKVLNESKYLSWNNDNLITLDKEFLNIEDLVVNNRSSFIKAISNIYSNNDEFETIVYNTNRVYFRIEHAGLGGADAYLGILKGNKLKLYCVWTIEI